MITYRAVSKTERKKKEMANVYEIVTERIIEQLEKGYIPWEKGWNGPAGAWSRSTGKPYSLINQWLLPKGEYVTFNQVKKEGGKVNKGAKAHTVFFWKMQVTETEDKETGEKTRKTFPILRYYNVFHVSDTTLEQKYNAEDVELDFNPIEEMESLFDNYLEREKISVNWGGDRACYSPSGDYICLPERKQFHSETEFYATAFHEIAHSTGHKSRLNRGLDQIAGFGTSDYSKEELVAELTSSAIIASYGLETEHSLRNNAAYIQSWIQVLKNDTKFIVSASSKADKAYKYITAGSAE